MMIPALRSVLDRVETWSEDRQAEAAAWLEAFDRDADEWQVAEADRAEIRRRMTADEPRVDFDAAETRLRRLLG